ncbi:type I-E CRISPR-associated protein Cas6/Cse3/CasE [Falsiroseomonas selenitidurans]|uniref:Type I-E CRISPR-associated protein Cas6/Cse3/CasE n=1 Tax=Falsiroseomonas selenitidurans TaxID=2716335 RepID=A0ABX1DZ93_9PROT|nr:type I-E CRISPR-associated protein Cas6/Cse3/CasE [Falsiroseomonas selenitidurans]NKC30224.1 type I-E CRISPR-associated protein Cas6/Cse3/CasE [Falsiroseomonas selenitidurans]
MTGLLLTRATLRRDAPVAALAPLLVPEVQSARASAAHRLIWALFSDGPDRLRDFLWREEAPGRFLALSGRPPNALPDIFDTETKDFAPELSAGDRLGFALRANPVIAIKEPGATRGKRHDVVMHALHTVPKGEERREARPDAVIDAGRRWLARQGEAHGFRPEAGVAVDGYETVRIPRPGGLLRFGQLDFQGVLTVTDPPRFLSALAGGFGRSRAFGCGLMLIRRAR